jgi:hypothetical protein
MAPLRRAAAQVNNLIRDCADGEYIVYAEIGDVLLDSDGRLSVAVSPDWLHFSERGYALLASRLEPVLDRVLAGAGSCCQPDKLAQATDDVAGALRLGDRLLYHLVDAFGVTRTGGEQLPAGLQIIRHRS